MSNSVLSNKEAMARLKPVQPKVVWGSRTLGINQTNLLALNDHEYIMPVGCGLLHFDNASVHTRKAKVVTTTYPDVEKVLMMCLSKDGQYLSTVVCMKNQQRNDIHLIIFYTKSHLDNNLRPRHIKYSANAFIPSGEQLQVTCMDFSHDSMYLACATNFTSIGTLVYDHLKGTIFQTIISDAVPRSLSFHPTDNGKMIVTGGNNFIKFWRFTSKSVHVAPVIGLRRGNFSYSQHAWLQPYSESIVVVGSDSGFLSILQNCEQRAPSHQAFGSSEYSDPLFNGISNILVRGDNVLAASPKNQIVLYEVRRVVLSKGISGLTATLFPLAYYRLSNVESLYGLDFALKSSVTSYTLIAATDSCVVVLDIISDHDLSGGNEHRQKNGENCGEDLFEDISVEKPLFGYHSSSIQSMSISSRGHVFMTSSFHDSTVRMWDFDDPSTFKSAWMVESFAERPEENPFHTDLHPNGLQVAAACESEVREYAVSDSQLDLVRRFGVRAPFQSSNGQPVVISQPVSLVKYSNGGHLLAVVTGKVVQIFHMFMNDLDGHQPGAPCRVMALCDHVSTVTDIAFMRDDNRMVTISSDGCVYSWVMGNSGREKEYIYKGIAATRVSVSTHHLDKCMIAVCFEGAAVETVQTLAADVVKRRRQSSIAVRTNSRHSLDGGPLLSAQSSSRMIGVNSINGEGAFERQGSFVNEGPVPVQQTPTGPKNYFVALWENEISANPIIAYCDVAIKAISLGRLTSPDSVDICVLGLADGRILVSTFPIPLLYVNPMNVTSSTTNIKPQLFHAGSISRMGGKKRKTGNMSMESVMESINEAVVPGELAAAVQRSTINDSIADSISNISPTKIMNSEDSLSQTVVDKRVGSYAVIDETNCKCFRLFVGAITHVGFSQEGDWIFAAGEDNSIHLISTQKRSSDEATQKQQLSDVSTVVQQFLMIDKGKMQHLRSKLLELEFAVEQSRKDNEMYITKLLEGKEKQMQELESKLSKEIQKRDENIIAGRKEYLQMKRSMQEEVSNLKQRGNDALSAMELMYEKKLAQEAVYLDKMKQAYDEFVVHSRMDMTNLQQQTESKIRVIENDKSKAIEEAERQKVAVLQYYEYIKVRNDEVLQSLEEQQADERMKLRMQLTETGTLLSQAQAQNMAGEVQASRTIQKLRLDIENKDIEVLRINSDIEWANERIQKLEQALDKATTELKARSDLVEKWETKTVELSKKIEDLEKIRKTLTTQLNMVQGELEPKQKELTKATDKLQEMNREYEISLHAITDKEKLLGQKAENLMALQKQVRELRTNTAQKEAALRRAAMSLEEFVYAMNEARFAPFPKNEQGRFVIPTNGSGSKGIQNTQSFLEDGRKTTKSQSPKSKKKPSSADGLLAALNLDPTADNKLKRLHDILKPYLIEGGVDSEYVDEMEAVRREQERHVTILHRNFHNLQSSLESSQQAAANKVANHLTDNQTLLNEVNNLRMEVKSLSLENHRLSAQIEYQATKHAAEIHAMHSLVLNSETDERYIPTSHKRKSVSQQAQPNVSPSTTVLPKILPSSIGNQQVHQDPSMDDSVDTNIPDSNGSNGSRSKLSKKTNKYIPTIEELLSTHNNSLSRSRSDFIPSKKDHILSQSVPLLALGSSISSGNQSTSSAERVSSADRKIAAIVELNLQELKNNKKLSKTQH